MGTIRSDWLARADAAVERLTDDLSIIDVRGSQFLLQTFVDSLESPPDALHGAVLSTILMDACSRIVQTLHEQNPPGPCSCETTIWSHVSRFGQWRDSDPRVAFRDWIDVFVAGIAKDHPVDLALRTAQVIRREPTRSWTLAALAAVVDARPLAVRREFETRYGMAPAAYLHLARVTKAIGLLRGATKVDMVARDVGYRSKKDLYSALSRWADATPTELRALSDDECEWLERELKRQCIRGAIERGTPAAAPLLAPRIRPGRQGERNGR